MEWIDASKTPPPDGEDVLVWGDHAIRGHRMFGVANFSSEFGWWATPGRGPAKVLLWCALPEPPVPPCYPTGRGQCQEQTHEARSQDTESGGDEG